MVSRDSLGTACPLSGRNSTYRPVQISETTSIHRLRVASAAPCCPWACRALYSNLSARPTHVPRCQFPPRRHGGFQSFVGASIGIGADRSPADLLEKPSNRPG